MNLSAALLEALVLAVTVGLAESTGQVTKFCHPSELFSEDLY